jgi:hypothetical protein
MHKRDTWLNTSFDTHDLPYVLMFIYYLLAMVYAVLVLIYFSSSALPNYQKNSLTDQETWIFYLGVYYIVILCLIPAMILLPPLFIIIVPFLPAFLIISFFGFLISGCVIYNKNSSDLDPNFNTLFISYVSLSIVGAILFRTSYVYWW